MDDTKKPPWQYCVVGNIVKTHIDETGVLRYGTVAYSGGTKVYLCGRIWDAERHTITVIGRIRKSRKHGVSDPQVALIENVRVSKVFHPAVLAIMNNPEFQDGWWDNTPEDRADAEAFVAAWKARFAREEGGET